MLLNDKMGKVIINDNEEIPVLKLINITTDRANVLINNAQSMKMKKINNGDNDQFQR